MNTQERFNHYVRQMYWVAGRPHSEALRITMQIMLDAREHPDDVFQYAKEKLHAVAEEIVCGREGESKP